MRARELGIQIGDLEPGPLDAITDVAGVKVGHVTLIEGDGALRVGHGPIRTGVSVIVPHDGSVWTEPLFAGAHVLNGNGELTGLEWIRESGMLMSPIALTNTHSVGVVRDALIKAEVSERNGRELFWGLPVVGETWDGMLNDINGFHITAAHVREALAHAQGGPVAEGSVGGGTGMICHGFKGGIGTASRIVRIAEQRFTVGVLVQANHGRRERLQVNGVPVGRRISAQEVPVPHAPELDLPAGSGSIIVVIATDAPLLGLQCRRLAQRAGLGIARTGGVGEHTSGDLFLCFSTANRGMSSADLGSHEPVTRELTALVSAWITPLFDAVVESVEDAIVSALLAAETMTGRDGVTAHRLPVEKLRELLAAR